MKVKIKMKKTTLHRYETNRPRSIKFQRKDQF